MTPMDTLALAGEVLRQVALPAQEAEPAKFQINLFWIIVSAANFIVFFLIVQRLSFSGIARTLDERRARIEQGLKDAEQARRDREAAEEERQAALREARREANELLARAQKVAADSREQDLAAARVEIERLRERATNEIDAERQRAIAELRGEVTDLALAAASRVVGESMSGDRQRRLVAEFLADPTAGDAKN
jgi:F-type H+-transporting ATPase subunit b